MLAKLSRYKARIERSAFALPLAILAAGMMIAISESAYHGSQSQLTDLTIVMRTRLQLLTLLQRITDAEAAQRGYILTSHKEYMPPYHQAVSEAKVHLQALKTTYTGNRQIDPEQKYLVAAYAADVRLRELQTVLELYERGKVAEARNLILTGMGRQNMDLIRHTIEDLLSSQNQLLTKGLNSISDTFLLNRIGVAAMTAISILMLVMFLRQSKLLYQQQLERQSELKAERDRLDREVKRRTADLTKLARHLQTAREDERARIARDLHDELGATLTAAKLDVARIRPKLQNAAPELMERLTHLTKTLNSGIALKRRIIEDLRPSTLDNLGLCPALKILCREFDARIDAKITDELSPVRLTPSAELTVFRLVQEAFNNIAKHAKARNVHVLLAKRDDVAFVRVSDDGVGFDPNDIGRSTHGLVGMRFRVEAEQGSLNVISAPGAGTTVEAVLPLGIVETASASFKDAQETP